MTGAGILGTLTVVLGANTAGLIGGNTALYPGILSANIAGGAANTTTPGPDGYMYWKGAYPFLSISGGGGSGTNGTTGGNGGNGAYGAGGGGGGAGANNGGAGGRGGQGIIIIRAW